MMTYTFLVLACFACITGAFTPSPLFSSRGTTNALDKSDYNKKHDLIRLLAVQSKEKGKGYEPKWKKKKTIADELGSAEKLGFDGVGLKGTIPVVFKQGNVTKTSMAWAGQPLRDVATQAGQFINYGCGKGECGTCECMVNGKWIRPCIATVPALVGTEPEGSMVVNVKAVKAKSTSSGKFYSIRSFLMGFWNNLLGMIGFVRFRKKAQENWEERQSYEDLVRQKVLEKKRLKEQMGTQ